MRYDLPNTKLSGVEPFIRTDVVGHMPPDIIRSAIQAMEIMIPTMFLRGKGVLVMVAVSVLLACAESKKPVDAPAKTNTGAIAPDPVAPLRLNLPQAEALAQLPLDCLQTQYPNKLNQILKSAKDIASPQSLHPAFYGCFDWHSAVHGHWSLVRLLKSFPQLSQADLVRQRLRENITIENIAIDLGYFRSDASFERTYGWAWLLKLAEELHGWDDPLARELEHNLQPLTDFIADRYIEFLPRLIYPIRVGEHTNTAFGLAFAWDYAIATEHHSLQTAIRTRALAYYGNDDRCPLDWEPGGYDFLSPCFEEIHLMNRILGKTAFDAWLEKFMPTLKSAAFNLAVARVSDRSDCKLVHLDGLNFSRAWVMYDLANRHSGFEHLIDLANRHVNHSLPELVGDSYEGGHWLGSFAIYALSRNDP